MIKNIKYAKLIITIFSILLILFSCNSYATNSNSDYDLMNLKEKMDNIDLSDIKNEEDLKNYFSNKTDIKESDIVEIYTELTENFSNQDIANMIEENKKEIINKSGIDEKDLNTGTSVLRSLDTKETKKILEEDLNIKEIQEKLNNGYTISEVVKEIEEQMPTSQKASMAIRLLLASKIVRTTLTVSIILTLYMIIIRWVIFRKAKRHGWATIIPIYNQITYLKVCGISPWWILIVLIPIIGWIIYGIIQIISRFTLAKSFGKGIGFGLGLLLLAIIFETILAFNRNIKYIEDEE